MRSHSFTSLIELFLIDIKDFLISGKEDETKLYEYGKKIKEFLLRDNLNYHEIDFSSNRVIKYCEEYGIGFLELLVKNLFIVNRDNTVDYLNDYKVNQLEMGIFDGIRCYEMRTKSNGNYELTNNLRYFFIKHNYRNLYVLELSSFQDIEDQKEIIEIYGKNYLDLLQNFCINNLLLFYVTEMTGFKGFIYKNRIKSMIERIFDKFDYETSKEFNEKIKKHIHNFNEYNSIFDGDSSIVKDTLKIKVHKLEIILGHYDLNGNNYLTKNFLNDYGDNINILISLLMVIIGIHENYQDSIFFQKLVEHLYSNKKLITEVENTHFTSILKINPRETNLNEKLLNVKNNGKFIKKKSYIHKENSKHEEIKGLFENLTIYTEKDYDEFYEIGEELKNDIFSNIEKYRNEKTRNLDKTLEYFLNYLHDYFVYREVEIF